LGKITLDIREDNFVKKYTENYDLSILIGVDRFTFSVVDAQQNVLLLRNYTFSLEEGKLESIESSLKQIYISDDILKYSFKKTSIALMHAKNTIVPSSLYQENQEKTYLENVISFQPSDFFASDRIEALDAFNIYATNQDIVKQLQAYFPKAKFSHALSALLLGYRAVTEHQANRQICINIRELNVQMMLFENKELLFSNTFKYQSSKDFIYYVMLLYDQFKLNPEIDPIHISGQIVEDSEIYHLLYRYVRHLTMVPKPSYYRFSKDFDYLPDHFYFDLYCLKLCE